MNHEMEFFRQITTGLLYRQVKKGRGYLTMAEKLARKRVPCAAAGTAR